MWKKIKTLLRMNRDTKSNAGVKDNPIERGLVDLARKHGSGQTHVELNQQNRMCLSCPIGNDPVKCYNEHGRGLTLWLEERRVTHSCSDASQFTYMGRLGIKTVECPIYQANVDVRYYEATVIGDVLVWEGHEFNLIGKSEKTLVVKDDKTQTERMISFQKPMFVVQAVEPSWDAFTDIVEKECENREALREFLVEDSEYTEVSKYERRIEE